MIDPGHGGHDPGAQSKGLNEADLTLDIALRLEKLLQQEAGLEVVLTRRTDVYISLEERTGRRVFEGENSVQIVVKHIREHPDPLPPDVPANVRALVARAMDKDPDRRFPDGATLLAAIDDVLAGSPPPAAPARRPSVRPVAAAGSDAAGPTGTAVMPLPALPSKSQSRRPNRTWPRHRPSGGARRR